MATWGLHLRIAEKLFDIIPEMEEESFVVGNIGPDCGVPNEDWSVFTPHTNVTHWKKEGKDEIQEDRFREAYLKIQEEDTCKRSFLLGY